MEPRVKKYLEHYLASLTPEAREQVDKFDAYHFCANEEDANVCARLVRSGDKRATASLLWAYEAEEEPLPQVGELAVITDWDGEPQAVIEITSVEVRPFGEVDEAFAFEEGEGDKSLAYWRKVHWQAFTPDCEALGVQPSEEMPVVLERFRVVYQE
ncbi:MAG TPA: ASCH domain-containing protein [Anaerolineales bacterium]|nr:ASCH domain-containing protein [Anaerolineales bacterium]